MKTLLLFEIESSRKAFDADIFSMLKEEQTLHKALYRMDVVRVLLGERSSFSAEHLTWEVRADGSGDPKELGDCAAQLVTELFSRITAAANGAKSGPDGCEMVLISSGDSDTNMAVLQLGRIVTARLLKYVSVNTHLILLQNQKLYKDEKTAKLLKAIRRCNSETTPFYSTLYMFPWEADRQKNTRRTISALVKTAVLGGGHALSSVGMPRNSEWIETSAVTRLTPPVAQIKHKVFKYLAGEFNKNVLDPALSGESGMNTYTNDIQDCVQEIRNTLEALEKRNGLPPIEELYMIMPMKNPTRWVSERDSIPVGRAWEIIFSIYGEKSGRELYERMYPDMDKLRAEYASQRANITVLLLRKVLEVGSKRTARGVDCGFEVLPTIVDSIKLKVLEKLKRRGRRTSAPQRYSLALTSRQRSAVNAARTRHTLLNIVYDNAVSIFGDAREQMREKMFCDAAEDAKVFLSACMLGLRSEFDQMCSQHDFNLPQQEYFGYRLDEAYDYWCRQSIADKVGLSEMYECFTEDVLRMPYDAAACSICDRLEAMIEKRTQNCTNNIRAHLGSFFAELKFRAGLLLSASGKPDDLNSQLLQHLQEQLASPPLMHMVTIQPTLQAVSRMFIIHLSSSSKDFADLVTTARNGAGILNDPYEDGVQMIVKYAGNAIGDLAVTRNNLADGAEP